MLQVFFFSEKKKEAFDIFPSRALGTSHVSNCLRIWSNFISNMEIKTSFSQSSPFHATLLLVHGFLVEMTVTTECCMASTSSHKLKWARCNEAAGKPGYKCEV